MISTTGSQILLVMIRSKQRKYLEIVSAGSSSGADKAQDLLANPSRVLLFNQLKAVLLQRTGTTQHSCLQQRPSFRSADRCPNQLLFKLKQLLSNHDAAVDGLLLCEPFLQQLPANVQMALTTASATELEWLVTSADSVMEASAPSVATFAGL